MRSVSVRGKFITEDGKPISGRMKFIPSKIWIEEDDVAYPCLAPEVPLVNGSFDVELTCTDTHPYGPWHYTVESPIGSWSIQVKGDQPLLLRDLMPKRTFRRQ